MVADVRAAGLAQRRRRGAVMVAGLAVTGLLAGLVSGCGTVLDPGVAGSGRIVEAEPPVDELTGLQVGSAFDVALTPGPEPAVLIRADDNVIDMVTAEVTGGVLRIGLDGRARNATLEAEVTVPPDGLASIDLDGASTATATDPVTGDSVEITAEGASRVFLVVSAQEVTVQANGASTVNLTGEASELTASADGASTIELVELPVATAEVDAGGASTVELTVTGTLTARAGGASTIRYSGSPDEVDRQTGGASTISPAQ